MQPNEQTQDAPTHLSDDDRKHFSSELLSRLKGIEGEESQQWYLALITQALDATNREVDKAFNLADRIFANSSSQDEVATKQRKSVSYPSLTRLCPRN